MDSCFRRNDMMSPRKSDKIFGNCYNASPVYLVALLELYRINQSPVECQDIERLEGYYRGYIARKSSSEQSGLGRSDRQDLMRSENCRVSATSR